ncbi:hypothetical protein BH10BAC3_BH10BAC3_17930 [soil metagenome]
MKQSFFKIRKVIYSLAITGTMVAFTAPVFATDKKDVNPVICAEPVVEIVGTDVSSSVFHVTLNTESKVKFELSVRGINGDVLFKDIYESENFSKYIKLVSDGDEMSNLSFAIRLLPNGKVHTFDVSSNVKLVKNVVVVKQ